MLGDFAVNPFGDILDDPGSLALTALKGSSALGTHGAAVLDLAVDMVRRVPVMSRMSDLGSSVGTSVFRFVRFGVDRHLSGGGGRMDRVGVQLGLQEGNTSSGGHQGHSHSLGSEGVELLGLVWAAEALDEGLDDCIDGVGCLDLTMTHLHGDTLIPKNAPV
jgi:hypothetical protein